MDKDEALNTLAKVFHNGEEMEVSAGDTARPPTPTGWSDTDWLKHLQEQQHPLAGLHINQGSMDAAADAYEAEYNARHNAEIRRQFENGIHPLFARVDRYFRGE